MNSRNGLIDGWRGISVLLVIFGHLISYRYEAVDYAVSLKAFGLSPRIGLEILLRALAQAGDIGVRIFFVISGYLITSLLLAEETSKGKISILAFYVRRFFRIVPAFALYFATVLALRTVGLLDVPNEAFVRSALYVCNVSGFKCSWWFGHTWSLSVEEQFYLAWPCLFLLIPSRAMALTLTTVGLCLFAFYALQAINFAHIAIGALIASSPRLKEAIAQLATPSLISLAAAFLFLRPVLAPAKVIYVSSIPLLPVLTAIVFFGTISGRGPFSTLVRQNWVQRIGLLSYSLYLWQQLGTAPMVWNGMETGAETLYDRVPLMSILFLIPAGISYIAIERPLIKVGHKLSRSIQGAVSDTQRMATENRAEAGGSSISIRTTADAAPLHQPPQT